jgi:mono/diheme cytochrome c family protein
MRKTYVPFKIAGVLIALQAAFSLTTCTPAPKPPVAEKPAMTPAQMAERGKYLVTIASCNDCHSPKIMTEKGPVVDESRLLSGSPESMVLPPIDPTEITPGKWYLGSSDLTAWIGPWGISYAANLTPDPETGSGNWTEELFIKMLRSGKFMGVDQGRPIMPPMPWEFIGKMTDDDLKSIYAYLRTLRPIKNKVHDYVPPSEIANLQAAK